MTRRLTQEEFLNRCKKAHGVKYDYSLTEYEKHSSKVKIICPEHGEFEQTANSHLNGTGCPRCGGSIWNKDIFIEKATEKHGNKYNYSLVEYVNKLTKVKIICSEHGEFEQTPNTHLKTGKCPTCKKESKTNKIGRLTNEIFLERVKEIHGDRYDYSLVEYVNGKIKVKIICPEHGEFEQTPHCHTYDKNGCPICSNRKGLTQEEFLIRCEKKHGDRYDYSLTEYVNMNSKVKIICSEHGEFEQTPYKHLKSNGCAICGGKLCNRDEFIKKSKRNHGDRYDYSLVEYNGTRGKVKIICPEHGEFEQTANDHYYYGCAKCNPSLKKPKSEYISLFIERHGDKYDYSKMVLINSVTKVKIICPEHGEFEQRPHDHHMGANCPKCAIEINRERQRSNTEEFVEKARDLHGDRYDYSLVEYIDSKSEVKIICNRHGVFKQKAIYHLTSRGCSKCSVSKGESQLIVLLDDISMSYDYNKYFTDCRDKGILPFDFYLKDYKICIEYDGRQHYEAIDFFGGEEGLKGLQKRDAIKTKYCEDNNIVLIRIRYDEDIKTKLISELKKYNVII